MFEPQIAEDGEVPIRLVVIFPCLPVDSDLGKSL